MRTLLVTGEKTFKITVPDTSKITFGPWTVPKKNENFAIQSNTAMGGTLRIYEGVNIIGVFTGVITFRDISIGYTEQVAKEEGAIIWKSDQDGYSREEKVKREQEFKDPLRIEAPKAPNKKPTVRYAASKPEPKD